MPMTRHGFPVMLTFDLDAETLWTGRDPANGQRPVTLSQGAYGWKVGAGRVLDLLERYGITATFFVPGFVIEQRRGLVEEILRRGHELAHHSYSHARVVDLSPEQEREEMEKGIELIRAVSGRPPAGYRSPAVEFSSRTLGLLVEHGFGYSSNFSDDDEPYLHAVDGRPSRIVELPFAWVLDDAPFFIYSSTLPGRTMHPPSAVLEGWIEEFEVLYREERAYVLTMHPQIIGRPSRIAMLEKLIRHIRSRPRVWFARCDQVADEVRPMLEARPAARAKR